MLAESFAPIVGGIERIVESLSVALAARGHEVSVATLSQPDSEPPTLEGVEVYPLGSALHRIPGVGSDSERRHAPPAPDPRTVLDLRRVIERTRPEVVHAHNWLVHAYLPLDRGSDAALVLSMHDYGLVCATKRFLNRGTLCTGPAAGKCERCAADYYGALKGPPIALATRHSEQRVRRHVDYFLPVSPTVARLCRVEGPHVAVVPNFVPELPPADPRHEHRLEGLPDGPYVFYFGDVTTDKGARHLVDVYRELDSPPPLVLAGRNYLDLDREPNVIALGKLPHPTVIEALRRSMFTVAPSILPETFGLVALESAAVGKPIIASNIGGLGDIVVDGETGLLVPPGDGPALRAALERLLGDEALRARMGASAREFVAAYGPEAVVPQFEAAYGAAVEARALASA